MKVSLYIVGIILFIIGFTFCLMWWIFLFPVVLLIMISLYPTAKGSGRIIIYLITTLMIIRVAVFFYSSHLLKESPPGIIYPALRGKEISINYMFFADICFAERLMDNYCRQERTKIKHILGKIKTQPDEPMQYNTLKNIIASSTDRFAAPNPYGFLIKDKSLYLYSIGLDQIDDDCKVQYDPTNGIWSKGDIFEIKHPFFCSKAHGIRHIGVRRPKLFNFLNAPSKLSFPLSLIKL